MSLVLFRQLECAVRYTAFLHLLSYLEVVQLVGNAVVDHGAVVRLAEVDDVVDKAHACRQPLSAFSYSRREGSSQDSKQRYAFE